MLLERYQSPMSSTWHSPSKKFHDPSTTVEFHKKPVHDSQGNKGASRGPPALSKARSCPRSTISGAFAGIQKHLAPNSDGDADDEVRKDTQQSIDDANKHLKVALEKAEQCEVERLESLANARKSKFFSRMSALYGDSSMLHSELLGINWLDDEFDDFDFDNFEFPELEEAGAGSRPSTTAASHSLVSSAEYGLDETMKPPPTAPASIGLEKHTSRLASGSVSVAVRGSVAIPNRFAGSLRNDSRGNSECSDDSQASKRLSLSPLQRSIRNTIRKNGGFGRSDSEGVSSRRSGHLRNSEYEGDSSWSPGILQQAVSNTIRKTIQGGSSVQFNVRRSTSEGLPRPPLRQTMMRQSSFKARQSTRQSTKVTFVADKEEPKKTQFHHRTTSFGDEMRKNKAFARELPDLYRKSMVGRKQTLMRGSSTTDLIFGSFIKEEKSPRSKRQEEQRKKEKKEVAKVNPFVQWREEERERMTVARFDQEAVISNTQRRFRSQKKMLKMDLSERDDDHLYENKVFYSTTGSRLVSEKAKLMKKMDDARHNARWQTMQLMEKFRCGQGSEVWSPETSQQLQPSLKQKEPPKAEPDIQNLKDKLNQSCFGVLEQVDGKAVSKEKEAIIDLIGQKFADLRKGYKRSMAIMDVSHRGSLDAGPGLGNVGSHTAGVLTTYSAFDQKAAVQAAEDKSKEVVNEKLMKLTQHGKRGGDDDTASGKRRSRLSVTHLDKIFGASASAFSQVGKLAILNQPQGGTSGKT
eukprot:gnl/MRDRNA2_/MRDRNA2_18520_c0_seq1.p1 gnl/MRDRNA2_/MRDRNA2_18520_c0~~gnl/MRDRNA2_/MRDRNA2_18520_c0_seq1.p1  ORF type:complete len:815 (+),score=150.51 gnl/MRDRNA2_/MRDRNA2_18520_c0_seq1:200-2446(+)